MDFRHRLRHVVGPLIGLSAVVYFVYHTLEGDRGVLAWMRLRGQIAQAEAKLATVSAERQQLEHKVLLLRPDHLDPDMLEERARIMLDMGHDDEVVVFDRKK
ncbi:MAG: septum formation initiator family protein [Magnetospirillum sp.]|nr:septum formation initiator family protein [Magnetospirillum sp.]